MMNIEGRVEAEGLAKSTYQQYIAPAREPLGAAARFPHLRDVFRPSAYTSASWSRGAAARFRRPVARLRQHRHRPSPVRRAIARAHRRVITKDWSTRRAVESRRRGHAWLWGLCASSPFPPGADARFRVQPISGVFRVVQCGIVRQMVVCPVELGVAMVWRWFARSGGVGLQTGRRGRSCEGGAWADAKYGRGCPNGAS